DEGREPDGCNKRALPLVRRRDHSGRRLRRERTDTVRLAKAKLPLTVGRRCARSDDRRSQSPARLQDGVRRFLGWTGAKTRHPRNRTASVYRAGGDCGATVDQSPLIGGRGKIVRLLAAPR